MAKKPVLPPPKTTTPKKDVAWVVTRIGKTPAKTVAFVFAPDAETAIDRAMEQARIPDALRFKLAARPR